MFFFQIFIAGHFYTAKNVFLYNHRQQAITVGRGGDGNAHQGISGLLVAGKYRILDTFQIADRFAGTEILLNRLLQCFFSEQKIAANLDLRNLYVSSAAVTTGNAPGKTRKNNSGNSNNVRSATAVIFS